jgi:hypothetical protein
MAGKSSRGRIKRQRDRTELLERGEGPGQEEQIDPGVDSPSEITTEGGPGTDAAYGFGGPISKVREHRDRLGGTGGDGGYSTLGGGVYPDEGSPEDAARVKTQKAQRSQTTRKTPKTDKA